MRPNLLFVAIDQFRGDRLSAAGHPVLRTPDLDRLAGGVDEQLERIWDALRTSGASASFSIRHPSPTAPVAPVVARFTEYVDVFPHRLERWPTNLTRATDAT